MSKQIKDLIREALTSSFGQENLDRSPVDPNSNTINSETVLDDTKIVDFFRDHENPKYEEVSGFAGELGVPEEELFNKIFELFTGYLVQGEEAPAEDQINGEKPAQKIPGGLSGSRPDSDFDPGQLRDGIKVETEHTSDLRTAKEITKDHLAEDPEYYSKLKKAKLEENKKMAKKNLREAIRETLTKFVRENKVNLSEIFSNEKEDEFILPEEFQGKETFTNDEGDVLIAMPGPGNAPTGTEPTKSISAPGKGLTRERLRKVVEAAIAAKHNVTETAELAGDMRDGKDRQIIPHDGSLQEESGDDLRDGADRAVIPHDGSLQEDTEDQVEKMKASLPQTYSDLAAPDSEKKSKPSWAVQWAGFKKGKK